MAIVNLSAPWIKFYREVDAMFKEDPEVNVVFDAESMELKLYVDDATKAEALEDILPIEKVFGNATVRINIIPANIGKTTSTYIRNGRVVKTPASKYAIAFSGNPVFRYEVTTEGVLPFTLRYIVFRNEVVQFFNDDLSDANGLCSTLYQEIAKDIFVSEQGVYFCTDRPMWNE